MRPRRILLLARDMVGDLVNTTGAVAWLRSSFPDATFVLEGGSASSELFSEIETWTRKRHGGLAGKLRRVSAYKKGNFDLAVVLDDSSEATRLSRLARIPVVLAPIKDSLAEHDMFGPLAAVLREVAERYELRFEFNDLAPALPLTEVHQGQARPEFAKTVLHVGASDLAKQWPESKWIELAQRVDCVIAGGPGEEALVERIATASGRLALPVLSLLDYAAVLEKAPALVTADTGPAHLAAAVGTRTIVLYGPTDPARFHPWGENWVALHHPMGCDHYGSGCAFRVGGVCSQTCMGSISVEEGARCVVS